MAVQDTIIQYSTNNSTWIDIQTPSEYKVSYNDLDKDSYRSVTNGNLIRRVIKRRWIKISMAYEFLTGSECNTICAAMNRPTLYIRAKVPAFGNVTYDGTSDWVTFKAYVSNLDCDTVRAADQYGYKLTFDIVQMSGGSFQ